MQTTKSIKTRKLTAMAMLAALSIVMVAVIHFPIFPAAAYLEYDPADIPILICTFAFGPTAGVIVTIIAALIQGLTVSAGSGFYGIIMHIVATCTFVLVAGNIYRVKKTHLGAALALLIGTVSMGVIMMPANLIITPLFTGMPVAAIKDLLLPVILPFNLIKAGINAVVVFIIYTPISKLLMHVHAK